MTKSIFLGALSLFVVTVNASQHGRHVVVKIAKQDAIIECEYCKALQRSCDSTLELSHLNTFKKNFHSFSGMVPSDGIYINNEKNILPPFSSLSLPRPQPIVTYDNGLEYCLIVRSFERPYTLIATFLEALKGSALSPVVSHFKPTTVFSDDDTRQTIRKRLKTLTPFKKL